MILMEKEVDRERFGRASKASAPEIIELNRWRANPTPFDVASYYCQILIHRAHVVMLAEEGIVSRTDAGKILKGIRDVEREAKKDTSLVGYMSTETALIDKIGEIGGKMHIARSRNDLGHTQRRMYIRDQIDRLIAWLMDFMERLLEKAEKNLHTSMPGYTHWRQAQPTTLAHYLLAHFDAAGRSLDRLEDNYKRTNLNPLGAAALAGTGWPINRERTMNLLGFDELCENSQDCVATIDYIQEFASSIAIHMNNLSRLAEDIQIWSSDEYKFIDFDEAYAGTSSIMPQKKNPLVMETVKSYASEAIGDLTSILTSTKGVSYTNTLDKVLLKPVSIDTAVGSTKVMAGLVSTLCILTDQMLKTLESGFSTMTDLADLLVKRFELSFRQAHDIVVEVSLKLLSTQKKPSDITPDMMAESSENIIGKKIWMTDSEIDSAIDPIQNIHRRKVIGGPAPDTVKIMITKRREELKMKANRHKTRKEKIFTAYRKLSEAEEMLHC
jgi:argininosuccinate lyase